MVWAKIINDEIMQMHDEDPAGLWHPDFLDQWEQVPENCHIGWKRKNGQWISGGQWMEEWMEENPPPPPGPPHANWSHSFLPDADEAVQKVGFQASPNGVWTSYSWTIAGEEYGQEEFLELRFAKQDVTTAIEVVLTVEGPGGTVTSDHKDPVVISAKPVAVPVGTIPTV